MAASPDTGVQDPSPDAGWPTPPPRDEPADPSGCATAPASATSGGGLRASDADRTQVATVLSTAFAEGRLTHEEHEERLDLAMRARTFDELIPLTDDLVPLDRSLPQPAPANRPTVDRSASDSGPDRFMALFSGFERKGRWRVRRHNQMLTLFGGGALDLTEAVLESEEIEITGLTMFGGVEIVVPEGVRVRDETIAVFGGSTVSVPPTADDAPLLVLKGLCMFGGVNVKTPKRGASERGDDHRPADHSRVHGHRGCGH